MQSLINLNANCISFVAHGFLKSSQSFGLHCNFVSFYYPVWQPALATIILKCRREIFYCKHYLGAVILHLYTILRLSVCIGANLPLMLLIMYLVLKQLPVLVWKTSVAHCLRKMCFFDSARESRNVWSDSCTSVLQQEQDRGEIADGQMFLLPRSGRRHN